MKECSTATTRSPGAFVSTFHQDVVQSLSGTPKSLSPKYFYDAEGSRLFDRICELPEYYLTRAELQIMQAHAGEMAQLLGPRITLLELGSGSSVKTRLLLDQLEAPRAYLPVDISESHLQQAAERIAADYPQLRVQPVCADFTEDPDLLAGSVQAHHRIIAYCPGSTLGNLQPSDAARLMKRIRRMVQRGGAVLLGLDTKKEVEVLERAYNDAAGVTAAFNLNLLVRMNRELGTDFDLEAFEHLAFYNPEQGRIEMHLRSRRAQQVSLGRQIFRFRSGETIHTENSYKYSPADLDALAQAAGFAVRRRWTDAQSLFMVAYLVPLPA